MTNRRRFLAVGASLAVSMTFAPGSAVHALPRSLAPRPGDRFDADDEQYWREIRAQYELDPAVINLDHGWTSPAPASAVDTLARYARKLEALPARHLSEIWNDITTTSVRSALADTMGVPAAEIALVRNATEALNTVLLGIPMDAGDELLCSAHDYYAMRATIEQRRRRDHITIRMVHPDVPAASEESLIKLYSDAMGPRTRLVLLTHPSNRTGQLLPLRAIAAAARSHGAEVIVDGAQSLGLTADRIADLGCDYYGASAHKWLGVPVGLGMLWMKPPHVGKVWPLWPPDTDLVEPGMGRFEWVGTTTDYVGPSALPALALHATIGAERKGARLRFLHNYLRAAIRDALPGSRFMTADDAHSTLSITTLSLPGTDVSALQSRLFEHHHILTQAFASERTTPEINGLRITPNVFSSLPELDAVVAALREELGE